MEKENGEVLQRLNQSEPDPRPLAGRTPSEEQRLVLLAKQGGAAAAASCRA
jgi:hypothetical protein